MKITQIKVLVSQCALHEYICSPDQILYIRKPLIGASVVRLTFEYSSIIFNKEAIIGTVKNVTLETSINAVSEMKKRSEDSNENHFLVCPANIPLKEKIEISFDYKNLLRIEMMNPKENMIVHFKSEL